jgi:3-oxoacyl-[acyl-carrier protein] reductase
MSTESASVALVTGARTGIGEFLAKRLLSGGYRVIGCSRSPIPWEAEGFQAKRADVSDESAVTSMVREIRREFGRLDVLVNNAGVASMNHVLLTPGRTVEHVLSTNVLGTFLVSREAAKLMRRHRFGRIVNFSTVAVPMRLEGEAAYVASKGAVEKLSQVMAGELAGFGITVNVVGPPPIQTDLIAKVPSEKIERLVDAMPLKRMGTMEDVANVVGFFIKPESSGITGQVVYIGGLSNS